MFCKWVNSWGPLREYWNVNEFLSFVIKFLSHFEFDFIFIFEQGCDMSEGQIRRGTLVRVLGTAPALPMGPWGPAAIAFSPRLFAEGKIRVRTRRGLMPETEEKWPVVMLNAEEDNLQPSPHPQKQLCDRLPLLL